MGGERPDVSPYEGNNDSRVLQLMQDCWGSDPGGRPTMATVTGRLEYLWKQCICYDYITDTSVRSKVVFELYVYIYDSRQ